MTPETRHWLDGLRDFAAAHRSSKPQPAPMRTTAEEAAERSILAAHLVSWLNDVEGVAAARRAFVRAPGGPVAAADDPAVVLTTSAQGIAAAEDVCGPGNVLGAALRPRLACVTELEYRLWCMRQPDDQHRLHVNHWNWIKTRVPESRWGEFARHPLAAGERYWLHRTGTSGTGPGDRRDCHLWKWNGHHAFLVEAFIREGLVSHFDRTPEPRSPE